VLPGDAKNTTAASNSAAAPIACHANHPSLSVIHLKYDTIPAFLVTKIVCESGAVAPTDVPSFLR
jgi:translation initiation factor 2B subunit (eIF-2B alpha/beta/delta family)